MKAACFTVAAMDFFPQQNKYFAGGNSLNQAIRFRQLGIESAFLGAIGTDEAGDRINKLLDAASVNTTHLYRISGATASNKIINDDQGERHGIDGAWNNGVYDDFRMNDSDWDFISGFHIWATHANCKSFDEALKRKSPDTFLAVDFLHFNTYELLEKGRKTIDIAYFGGVKEQLTDLIELSHGFGGIIVLTLGAHGSIAIKSGKTYTQEALQLDRVTDTTGCGDAFQAGFTYNYINTGSIEGALFTGAQLGRAAALHYGGVQWI